MRSNNDHKDRELVRRLVFQSELLFDIRQYFHSKRFAEISTPILSFPTKEYGDGEFLVISKLQPRKFYSLPHSPQLYKQYLLASFPSLKGYYQIAYNFRPELGDAIHGQEFRQIDFEIAHPSVDRIRKIIREVCAVAFSSIKIVPRFSTLKFDDAIRFYGSDSPDLRYAGGMFTYSDRKACFKIPTDDILNKNGLKLLLHKHKKISIHRTKNSFIFLAEDTNIEELGLFRNILIQNKFLHIRTPWSFVWLVDLPLFKQDINGRLSTFHHPQMAPSDLPAFWKAVKSKDSSKLLLLKGRGCELIVNGMELCGGNVRNSSIDIQKEILKICGADEVALRTTYKPLLSIFTANHNYKSAGAAIGLERLVLLLTSGKSLADGQAFPQDDNAKEFFGGPFNLPIKELQDLGLDYEHPILAQSRQSAIAFVKRNKNFIHDRSHIVNVEQNAVSIALKEGILPDELFIIRLAAHWHDVGRQDLLFPEIVPHGQTSARLFKAWAVNIKLPKRTIDRVLSLIRHHDNHATRESADKLLNILQDGDKLDILNVGRMHNILAQYNQNNQIGEYNYFHSIIFWNNMSKKIENVLHTASGFQIFKNRISEFNKFIKPLYRARIANKRKIIALGGAESISGVFSDLDKAILSTINTKRIKLLYVPIGVFNNPKAVNKIDKYAISIKKYYQTLGYNIDFDYIKPNDLETVIISQFEKAQIIYLAGGDTKFLISKLSTPAIICALKRAYKNGTILIGNSAGILSLLKYAVSFSYDSKPIRIKGLGILKNYCVLVHFSEKKKKFIWEIKKDAKNEDIITLSESGAAIFLNEKLVTTTEKKAYHMRMVRLSEENI